MNRVRAFGVSALLVALVVVCGSAEGSHAQTPFGFVPDTGPASYEFCKSSEPHWYDCTTAPRPHPDFGSYLILYVDGIGTCVIKGVGKTILDSGYGSKTKAAVDKIRDQLTKRYGRFTEKYDKVFGRLWRDPEYWLMGLYKADRFYTYVWERASGSENFGKIAKLGVTAKAAGSTTGYVVVEFYTEKYDQCNQEISNRESEAF